MNYYLGAFKKYAVFSGRASRAEYWYFILFHVIVSVILGLISYIIHDSGNILLGLYGLAVVVPSLAIWVRRLHDVGKSGWWILIIFIPLIGAIWMLVLQLTAGDPRENRYGPSPKAIQQNLI